MKANEKNTVAGDLGLESVFEIPKVFLPPEVSNSRRAFYSQSGPIDFNLSGDGASVKEAYGGRAVVHFFGPNFGVAFFPDAAGLAPERVLVNGENFVVGQEAEGKIVEIFQIAAE